MQVSPTVRKIVGPTILLYSGEYFDFLAPENSIFTIEDVAQGLSQTCRFAGQSSRFYSVAEHCVHMSYAVPPEHAYAALMHDATEAFIGDMSKPLKDLLPEYKAIETRIEAVVFDRFSVPTPFDPCIKEFDIQMLATEQAQIMRNNDGWDYTRGRKALPIKLYGWYPFEAKEMFLARYRELMHPSVSDGSREAGETEGLDPKDDSAIRAAETPHSPPSSTTGAGDE